MKYYILFPLLLLSTFVINLSGAEPYPQTRDIIIIGSGPAGLGAALVAGLNNKSTIVLTGPTPKGAFQYSQHPKNWPGVSEKSGNDIMTQMYDQVATFPIQFVEENAIAVTFETSSGLFSLVTDKGSYYTAKCIIVATGTSPKRLEKIENGALFRDTTLVTSLKKNDTTWWGKKIVVVGGGDDAVSKALKAAEKAESVTLLVRTNSLKVSQASEIDKLSSLSNVSILYNATLVRVDGYQNHMTFATAEIIDDESPLGFRQLSIPCEFVVEALGTHPNSDIVKPLVACDENGYIITRKPTTVTSCPGIFAAGVVSDPSYQQAFIAASEGMKAGYDAIKFLKNKNRESAKAQ